MATGIDLINGLGAEASLPGPAEQHSHTPAARLKGPKRRLPHVEGAVGRHFGEWIIDQRVPIPNRSRQSGVE